jgi:hypothetical protein
VQHHAAWSFTVPPLSTFPHHPPPTHPPPPTTTLHTPIHSLFPASFSAEVKHAKEQLTLRERHLREVSVAFVQLAPTDVLRREEAEEAEREAASLRECVMADDHTLFATRAAAGSCAIRCCAHPLSPLPLPLLFSLDAWDCRYQASLQVEKEQRLARIQREKEEFEAELRRKNEVGVGMAVGVGGWGGGLAWNLQFVAVPFAVRHLHHVP